MIVRRRVSRGLAEKGSTEEEPRRGRAKRFLLIVLSAGALSGLASLLGIPPFGNVQAVVSQVFYSGDEIQASDLYPPVKPTNQVIDVYDPPPAVPRVTQPPATSRPTQPPQATPRSTPRPVPSASPSPEPSDT